MLEKITPEELVGKGVIGLADTPKLTAPEMQQKFEETARGVIIPKFNALIEALAAETGANEIGASDPVTGENVTVQRALESLLKATVHTVVQDLTEDQKARARANIEAASATAVKALEEGKAPNSHAAQKETYGKGTGLLYGHVQLRDNPSEELDETKGAAATPKALHDAVAPLVSTEAQSTTEAQKAQARANIGAVNKEEAAAAGAAAVDEKYFDGVAEVMPETSVVCDEPIGQGAGAGYRSFKGEIDFDGGWVYDEGPKTALVRYEDSAGVQEVECQASYRMFEPGSNWVYYGNEYLFDSGRPNTGEDFLLAFRKGNFKQSNLYSRRNETVKVAVSKKAVNGEYLPRPADAVTYTEQELTDEQKTQARENIGAVSKEDVKEMLEDLPTGGASVDEALKAVEDKYFYEMGETLVPEMTVQCELVNSNGIYYYGGAGYCDAVAEAMPETVVVVVNGTQHRAAVQYTKGPTGGVSWVYIGNRSLSDSSKADTGEEFLLSSGVGSGATGTTYSRTAGAMTFSVHMAGNVLADEYLNPLVIKAKAQALSAAMQKQARENIGAVGGEEAVEAVEEKFFDLGLAPIYPEETVTTVAGSGPSSSHRSEAELTANGADFYNAQYEKVSVKINGEVVECGVTYWVADPGSRYASVGNMYLSSRTYPDTGEDFLISYRLARGASVIYTREPGEYTFTVNIPAPVMKPEYLPPMGAADAVTYTAQTLTDEQKAQARENIGAAAVGEGGGAVGGITWDDISVTYGDTLTWDGNIDGLPNVMGMFFKVSDAVPTLADVQKGGSFVKNGERVEFPADLPEEELVIDGIVGLTTFAIVPPEMAGVDVGGTAFPEAGTYLASVVELGGTVTELQLNGYNGFQGKEKIPKDRLPLTEIGGVANWYAQEGEPGYMLNKPFDQVHEVILQETEGVAQEGEFYFPLSKMPSVGGIYTVTWNGVEYQAEAIANGDYIAMQPENAPFYIVFVQGIAIAISTDGTTSLTLQIYRDYVKKLDSEFLSESGVTAGKYGSYGSGGYYFPIVTVDAYGRITAASEAVIPNVNNGMGDNGLMPYAMYSHIANSSHVTHALGDIPVGGEATMILGSCAVILSLYVSGAGYTAFPKVYGAYVYTYTDASKSNRYWVPVDPKYVKYSCSGDSMSATSTTATAVVALPEEYREYYAEGDSVPVLVIYEKVYSSSSSVM